MLASSSRPHRSSQFRIPFRTPGKHGNSFENSDSKTRISRPNMQPKRQERVFDKVIIYSDHDKNLQKQEIEIGKGKTGSLYLWRAICDERNIGSTKVILIFAYSKNVSLEILAPTDFKCQINGRFWGQIDVSIVHRNVFMCSFEKIFECPRKVSLSFRKQTVTNELIVERQYQEKSLSKNMSITLCSPAITKMMDISSPRRLIEYVEYQRFAGIKRMILGELDGKVNNFTLAEDSKSVLRYYKGIGFLDTFEISVTNGKSSLYNLSRSSAKVMQFTYCMIKYALISDYIIVQDLDEIVGFNTTRYRNLPEAISAAEDKNYRFSSFMLKDQPVAKRCNYSKHGEINSSFLMMRTNLFYQKSFNMGKTIHSSQTCQIAWHHGCSMPRREETFSPSSRIDKFFSKTVNMQSNEKTEIMRSLHFRDFLRAPKNISLNDLCCPNNTIYINWLNNISGELLSNCATVVRKLNV